MGLFGTVQGGPDLDEESGKVSTWNGVRSLTDALERLGGFAVLRAEVGELGHPTEAAAAEPALAELAAFRATEGPVGELVRMVVTGTGEELGRFDASLGGPYVLTGSGPQHVSFDERGLFVVPAAERQPELFRAMRVEQRLLAEPRRGGTPVEYTDLDTGRRFEGRSPVEVRDYHPGGGFDASYPGRMHVETQPFGVDHFAGQVATLEALFRASARTGNPVHWSS